MWGSEEDRGVYVEYEGREGETRIPHNDYRIITKALYQASILFTYEPILTSFLPYKATTSPPQASSVFAVIPSVLV